MGSKRMLMKSTRRDIIDPAVAELLSHAEDKRETRSLPLKEQKRKAKEKQKMQARNRVMYDLPPVLVARIKVLASDPKNRVPESQVAALLIWQGLLDLDAGKLNLMEYRQASKAYRYDWNLVLPVENEKKDG